jgi:threonine synthase
VAGPDAWSKAQWLPNLQPVSLGEPVTPLVSLHGFGGCELFGKLEGALPTGSFKDRGSAALVSWLRSVSIDHVTVDSSGNAGASMAAYCATAGIRCDVFVPAAASKAKLTQVRAYGSRLSEISGSRSDVTEAAINASGSGGVYASHMWNPYFLVGTQTFAHELTHQLAAVGRSPATIIFPLGAGTLLLGAYRGFSTLMNIGLIERIPRLVGVQASVCAPLARAFADTESLEDPCGASLAEGILIANPPRAEAVLAAINDTGGAILTVEESAIAAAFTQLARRGVYVEPTSATTVAGLTQLTSEEPSGDGVTVVALTGSGLKGGEVIAQLLDRST